MRQLWFIKKNTLEWREVAEPKLDATGQAIVRTVASYLRAQPGKKLVVRGVSS